MARIIAVTSGKGGVGKTSFAVNLGTALAARERRVLLLDADLGLANAHILCGSRPEKTLSDYVEGRAEIAEIIAAGPGGLKMISGGSGVAEMANLGEAGREKIVQAVLGLDPWCDAIIVDTAAGISRSVTDFVRIADEAVVVCTPNFAAIADAYGIMKVVASEGFRGRMHLVVNRVLSMEEAEGVYKKLQGCTTRFLNLRIELLGYLPEDPVVNRAVQRRTPFLLAFPDAVASRYMGQLAEKLETLIAGGLKTG